MSAIRQSTVRNRLLTALPPEEFAGLSGFLEPVSLSLRQDLYVAGAPIEFAHFVETGMVSLIASLGEGEAMEVGLVGAEGLVGVPVVLGADAGPHQAIVQMQGSALRIATPALRQAFAGSEPLRARLLRYVMALHVQVAQTAACNGRHRVERRLARWLLMAHDRAGGDRFPMTQEFIALMLGVRRAGVSVAAGTLRKTGAIDYENGSMSVIDRPILEAASCECYAAVREQFDRLLG